MHIISMTGFTYNCKIKTQIGIDYLSLFYFICSKKSIILMIIEYK